MQRTVTLKVTMIDNVSGDRLTQVWEYDTRADAMLDLEKRLGEQKNYETIRWVLQDGAYRKACTSPAAR